MTDHPNKPTAAEIEKADTPEWMTLAANAIYQSGSFSPDVNRIRKLIKRYYVKPKLTTAQELKDKRFDRVCAFAYNVISTAIFEGFTIDGADMQDYAEKYNIIEILPLTQEQVDSDDYNTEELDLTVGDDFCHVDEEIFEAAERHQEKQKKEGKS